MAKSQSSKKCVEKKAAKRPLSSKTPQHQGPRTTSSTEETAAAFVEAETEVETPRSAERKSGIESFEKEKKAKIRAFLQQALDELDAEEDDGPKPPKVPNVGVGSSAFGARVPNVGNNSSTFGTRVPNVGVGSSTFGSQVPNSGVYSPIFGGRVPNVGVGSSTFGTRVPNVGIGSPIFGTRVPDGGVGSHNFGTHVPNVGIGSPIFETGIWNGGLGPNNFGTGVPNVGSGFSTTSSSRNKSSGMGHTRTQQWEAPWTSKAQFVATARTIYTQQDHIRNEMMLSAMEKVRLDRKHKS